jgi:glutamate dehydrogenase
LVGKEAREKIRNRAAKLRRAGVEDALAKRVAGLSTLFVGLDIVEVVASEQVDLGVAAAVHFTLGDRLGLNWMMERINALARDNNWQSLARAALRDDLMVQHRLLTADALQGDAKGKAAARVDGWIDANDLRLARLQHLLGELRGGGNLDFTMLSVALRELRALASPVAQG